MQCFVDQMREKMKISINNAEKIWLTTEKYVTLQADFIQSTESGTLTAVSLAGYGGDECPIN